MRLVEDFEEAGLGMTQRSSTWWKFGVVSVIGVSCATTSFSDDRAWAQSITLDGSLGLSGTLTGPNYTIPQGAGQTVGSNLFHSFGQFGLNTGETAIFESANINNILSRVTGGSPSIIDGQIFTRSSSVNLFLINPSGIVFGPNASLDVGGTTRGSFVATTVDAISWSNGRQFSATNPGGPSSLLTLVGDPSGFIGSLRPPEPIFGLGSLSVAPSQSLLLLGGNVEFSSATLTAPGGRVEIGGLNGAATVRLNSDFSLSFPDNVGRSDVFVGDGTIINVQAGSGGNIGINARNLDIFGASAISAGIASGQGLDSSSLAGDITLNATDTISVGQESIIENNVRSNAIGNSGKINIQTGSLFVSDGAQIQNSTLGFGNTGIISIAANDIFLTGIDSNAAPSGILNNVEDGAVGKAGTITITTDLLSISDGAQIQALTRGLGNAGEVNITAIAGNVVLSGINNGTPSGIFSTVENLAAQGTGGIIRIQADSLGLFDGAQIQTQTNGQGTAGSIAIVANDIVVSGFDPITERASEISSGVAAGAQLDPVVTGEENAFGVVIIADSLLVSDRGLISTDTAGIGTAGVVFINATGEVSVTGSGSKISSDVTRTGRGDGVGVLLSANTVSIADGGEISSSTSGFGDAGVVLITDTGDVSVTGIGSKITSNVNSTAEGDAAGVAINASTLSLSEGAEISSSTFGTGNAGGIFIQANDSISLANSNISTTVKVGASGNAGEIAVETGNLSFSDASGIYSTIEEPEAPGSGGKVTIQANSLSLLGGAQIQTLTRGLGNAGEVDITAGDIVVSGAISNRYSGIYSTIENTEAPGSGGKVTIKANSLSVLEGAQIQTLTRGLGNAGEVDITATGNVLLSGSNNGGDTIRYSGVYSTIENPEAQGSEGKVTIKANSLSLLGGAQIQTLTYGKGDPGAVGIFADKVSVSGFDPNTREPSAIYTSVEAGAQLRPLVEGEERGFGVLIATDSLSVSNGGRIVTNTRGVGTAGVVAIQASGDVTVTGDRSTISSDVDETGVGNATGIVISANSVNVNDNGQISSSTFGIGNAGEVIVQANESVSLSRGDIFTSVEAGAEGTGGVVRIVTDSLAVSNGGRIVTDTSGSGKAGVVGIQASGDVTVTGDRSTISSNVNRTGVGDAVGVVIDSKSVAINDGADVSSSSSGRGNAGGIFVRANEISLAGGNISTTVKPGAVGIGGAIALLTDSLLLTDGAVVSADTFSIGDAGNIIVGPFVEDDDSFVVNNSIFIQDGGSKISTSVGPRAQGKGGGIALRSQTLSITNGGEVIAQTLGEGKAGAIGIDATDSVEISGVAPFLLLVDGTIGGGSSGLFSTSEEGASGNGGEIEIATNSLRVADGATISTRSRSAFTGGNITVNARELDLSGGGQLLSTAFSSGNAGNITINVSDRITIAGTDPTYFQRLNSLSESEGAQRARQILEPIGSASGIFADTVVGSSGNGGSISIDPRQFTISDGGRVSVSSSGQGNGGNLQIQAGNLTLNRNGAIEATTASGEGGNINISAQDLLLLRRNSNISSKAGGSGDGGNIDINTTFIVAQPQEDSNIIADAIKGRGGNINIAAQGIFGIQSRPEQTSQSDITASSELGIDGTVDLNTPDVDPAQGLVALPVDTVDASSQIAAGCTNSDASVANNKFTVTGRGGLPPNPGDTLGGEEVLTDWATLKETEVKNPQSTTTNSSRTNSPTQQVVEAQGWVIDAQGKVILTAQAPEVTPNSSKLNATACQK